MSIFYRLYIRLYRWAALRLYNEFAWAYDAVSAWVSLGHWDDWRRQVLDYITGDRVLELAFGTGDLLVAMAERGWHVWGLDLSPAMQRITARKLRRAGLQVPRMRARVQALPCAACSFDTVVATFPTEYVLDPATLREVYRVLRPGGRFIITGLFSRVRRPGLRWLLRPIYGGATPDMVAHYQALVAACGFTLSTVAGGGKLVAMPVFVWIKLAEVPEEAANA